MHFVNSVLIIINETLNFLEFSYRLKLSKFNKERDNLFCKARQIYIICTTSTR